MSQPDTEALAKEVVEELDPGQIIDNKVVLSRRQLVAIAGSGLGAGALAALGVDEAAAQAAGQQGTASSPNDMFAWDLNVANQVTSDLPMGGNDLTHVGTADIDSLVIGGTLYEEDPNSPINTSTDDTVSLANSYDDIIIVTQPGGRSFDQLQVNGNSDTNYNYTDNSDTQTTGQAQFDFAQPVNRNRYVALRVLSEFDQIGMSTEPIIESTGATVSGRYQGTETSIDSLTLIDSGGASRTVKARVYGRSMNV